jgi:hypothetical protein
VVGSGRVDETGRLLAIDGLLKVGHEEKRSSRLADGEARHVKRRD